MPHPNDRASIVDAEEVMRLRTVIAEQYDEIERLRSTLRYVAYWCDTDQEIFDAMSDADRVSHERLHKRVREALKSSVCSEDSNAWMQSVHNQSRSVDLRPLRKRRRDQRAAPDL